MKILVLCHGNINRSPAAEAVLRDELGSAHEVRSAALKEDKKIRRAAKRSRMAMADRGYDLEAHRSHQVTAADLDWADRIVYMDAGNLKRIKLLEEDAKMMELRFPEIVCLAHYDNPPSDRIRDPNFINPATPEFQAIMDQIVRCCKSLAAGIIINDNL